MSVSSLMRAEDAAALLGVPLDADLPALRRAFRRLSAAWGPDKVCYAIAMK
jgi:curved DNA-binding protein CbpA